MSQNPNHGEIESGRRALLKYYTSQSMTHGGYIIALGVGFITLLSRLDYFFTPDWSRRIVFYVLFSLATGLSTNIIGRTLYWGCLSHAIMYVQAQEIKTENTDVPLIGQLHNKACEKLEKTEDFWWHVARHFSSSKFGLAIVAFLLTFVLFFFVDIFVMQARFAPFVAGKEFLYIFLFIQLILFVTIPLCLIVMKTRREQKRVHSEKKI